MASGKNARQYIFEDVVVVTAASLAAGAGSDYTVSVAKTGYTPVGIVGVRKTGSSYASVPISRFHIDDQQIVHVAAFNPGDTARTVTITVTVMYRKTS